MDLVVNDLAPDIVHQLRSDPTLQVVEAPGTDYAYVGINLRDPVLQGRRVCGRRWPTPWTATPSSSTCAAGWRRPAVGILPPMSWAFTAGCRGRTASTRRRPARCSTRRAIAIRTAPGPPPRLQLTLKISSTEFNRLQSSVLQQDFARVGVALDVRTYEFATLYADVLKGNFQLFTLQWVGVSDPDMLRRVFHTQADAAERVQPRVLQQRPRWMP